MTCIVGLVDKNKVWLGGDSLGSFPDWSDVWNRPKVFRKGNMLIGYTTSFRMGQLLEFSVDIPEHKSGIDTYAYLATDFVDSLRFCFHHKGFMTHEKDQEIGGNLLVGYRGRLFEIQDDFAVLEATSGCMACGCGFSYALGSLHTTGELGYRISAKTRVLKALEAAARYTAVAPPFVVKSISAPKK